MAPEIDETVLSWSNFLLQLFRRQAPKQLLRSFHVGLPPAECGIDERLLCSHSLPSFHLDDLQGLSHGWGSDPTHSRLKSLWRALNSKAHLDCPNQGRDSAFGHIVPARSSSARQGARNRGYISAFRRGF